MLCEPGCGGGQTSRCPGTGRGLQCPCASSKRGCSDLSNLYASRFLHRGLFHRGRIQDGRSPAAAGAETAHPQKVTSGSGSCHRPTPRAPARAWVAPWWDQR